jgi:hypothetical protein
MSDIVNIQITPVKEIVVLPIQENFENYPTKSSSQRRKDHSGMNMNTQYYLKEKEKKKEASKKKTKRAEMFDPTPLTSYQIKSLEEKGYEQNKNDSSSSSGTTGASTATSGTSSASTATSTSNSYPDTCKNAEFRQNGTWLLAECKNSKGEYRKTDAVCTSKRWRNDNGFLDCEGALTAAEVESAAKAERERLEAVKNKGSIPDTCKNAEFRQNGTWLLAECKNSKGEYRKTDAVCTSKRWRNDNGFLDCEGALTAAEVESAAKAERERLEAVKKQEYYLQNKGSIPDTCKNGEFAQDGTRLLAECKDSKGEYRKTDAVCTNKKWRNDNGFLSCEGTLTAAEVESAAKAERERLEAVKKQEYYLQNKGSIPDTCKNGEFKQDGTWLLAECKDSKGEYRKTDAVCTSKKWRNNNGYLDCDTGSTATSTTGASTVTSTSGSSTATSNSAGVTSATAQGNIIVNKDASSMISGPKAFNSNSVVSNGLPPNALSGSGTVTNLLPAPSAGNDIDKLKKSLQNNAISGQVQNTNFILNSQGSTPSAAAVAVSQNAMKADASYAELKNQVRQTNDISIQKLRTEYDEKIKTWKSNYDTSIKSYKEYVSELEKKQGDAETKNKELVERLTKNESRLNDAVQKWNAVQDNISKYEQQLVIKSSNTEKKDSTIKQLQIQLAEEKNKQDSITAKLNRLREEKQTLDQSYLSNLEKLKKVGFGSNCPKGVNMNDYILKKNIPCWGCILK